MDFYADLASGREAPARLERRGAPTARLKDALIKGGIKLMCGRADAVSVSIVTDIPLASAAVRLAWLKVLGAFGVKSFLARSGLGHQFLCHTGDLANYPYYYRGAYRAELGLAAAWLKNATSPVIYDVGANDGFFSAQLAQMLAAGRPRIHGFEPVPSTFAKLVQSTRRLGLAGSINPVEYAIIDRPGRVWIGHCERKSLLAQVCCGRHRRAGERLTEVQAMTLDDFHAADGGLPDLIKIDVEGSEVAALRGARGLLSRPDRPAILFEFNPIALAECGVSARSLLDLLSGYALHYVDDLRGQLLPFGSPVQPERIDWICNLFAVPTTAEALDRWAALLAAAAGPKPPSRSPRRASPPFRRSGFCR